MPQLFRIATVFFILFLFTVGSFPAASQVFPGTLHFVAHLFTYALIAFLLGMGWQKLQVIIVAAVVASIGCIHEVTEIITHSHGLEMRDVVINAIGAVIGSVALIAVRMNRNQ